MKCIKNQQGVIHRVSDDDAEKCVKEDGWSYCPKCELKEQRRKIAELSASKPLPPKKEQG